MYYTIRETLTPISKDRLRTCVPYVAVLTSAEWATDKDLFDMGIDMEAEAVIITTKAEVNYDSLTGGIFIPDRENPEWEGKGFAFALDEKGIVFIDDTGAAQKITESIRDTKRCRFPSLERFIYDFFEKIVTDDKVLLENYDRELDCMEDDITGRDAEILFERINDIRGDIRDLRVHYEQLIDFGEVLEENENNFFKQENLRYFRMFTGKIERLRDRAAAVSDHVAQVRDIYNSNLEVRLNRIMKALTIITATLMPVTLITGWYGMNFKNMPELDKPWGYPLVIAICAAIVVLIITVFKKKDWL
ncbi:MAG: magnesium transporter CorA [Abditibacteriota bacterium]|nr:magnesium transporter CorA [Abditibacteriota bacterium]